MNLLLKLDIKFNWIHLVFSPKAIHLSNKNKLFCLPVNKTQYKEVVDMIRSPYFL